MRNFIRLFPAIVFILSTLSGCSSAVLDRHRDELRELDSDVKERPVYNEVKLNSLMEVRSRFEHSEAISEERWLIFMCFPALIL